MNRTRIVWTIALAATLLGGIARADEVIIGGLPRRGSVTGVKDFEVQVRLSSGRQISTGVAGVSKIRIDGQDTFNDAEKLYSQKKYTEAAAMYRRALRSVVQGWMKRLIRYRLLMTLDKAGQINDAVEEWLGLVEEHSYSARSLRARPDNLAKKGSADNAKAIGLLEAKLPRVRDKDFRRAIKAGLLSLYNREGMTDKAAKLAGEELAQGDDDDDKTPRRNGNGSKPDIGNLDSKLQAAATIIEQARKSDKLTGAQRVEKASSALRQLKSTVKSMTTGQLAPALLWMGKAQHVIAQHGEDQRDMLLQAGLNYMRVVAHFAASKEAPEALMLAGKVNEQLGNKGAARAAYAQVQKVYAKSDYADAAKKAQQRLTTD
jgi:tetratricopeptide (TPR) repeat protein